jgi:hypothetical protein
VQANEVLSNKDSRAWYDAVQDKARPAYIAVTGHVIGCHLTQETGIKMHFDIRGGRTLA